MPDGNTLTGAEEICDHYRNLIIFYDSDGNVVPYQRGECTPRTRHVITNLVFDFDNAVKAADVRSYFTAYQTIGDRNEIIAGGRYVDHFELDLQGWHIVEREIFLDNQGDMSQHLTALFE
jgi:3-phenylpropionate/cinnamic acid dioxygenase small subunit